MKAQVFCDGRAKFWDKLAQSSDNLLGQNENVEEKMKDEKLESSSRNFVSWLFCGQT